MAVIDSAFTLPGLAGIALTIGIAVDSNVLIYERMREELERGSSLRMAIKNGFDRAFSAIIDSNVTTLISAVILYMIGTDQIRGFAVTLFIGLVVSLFTVLYFGRLLFEIAEKKRWITKLKMMKLLGHTDIDFIGKQKYCWFGSAVIIIGGLACFAYRGGDNYDVDLSGGTMVTFQFTEPQNIVQVRQKLENKLESISLERLTMPGETQTGDEGKQFRVRTKEQDLQKVREEVAEALAGSGLRRVTMTYGSVSDIPATPAPVAGTKDGRHSHLRRRCVAVRRRAPGHCDFQLPDQHGDGPRLFHGRARQARRAQRPQEIRTGLQPGRVHWDRRRGNESRANTRSSDFRRWSSRRPRPSLETTLQKVLAGMQKTMAASPAFDQVNTFEGGVAEEMKQKAVLALVVSFIAIIIYLWFRFERVVYGLALILAVIHDCLLVLGMIAVGAYASRIAVCPLPGAGELQDRHGHDRRVHDDRRLFAQRHDRRV